ncbi:MAG TPA: hypothetical protein VFB38_13630 [Chthonomonadaceae bacterium]|nr:hypothetical protein [Chthonomonadaceae bacterium]
MLFPPLVAMAVLPSAVKPMPPISLHPDNPHYFLFRGKPTVLITSAEHYGAVLNQDFNYLRYLETLHADGLNYTRIFTGVYMEDPAAFNIRNNTLAPAPGRLLCPWARSSTPGYAGGGNKFDLNTWDDAYFHRLKDFCTQAGRRGIVVEVSLFCPYYQDSMWEISPLKASNNIQGIGDVPRTEALTLKHPSLVAAQEAMVRKIVQELKDFDNVFYEICNEAYFGGVTLEWQAHISQIIAETEAAFPHRHLIAQNIANGSAKIESPDPRVSIFNFHYAAPPDAVTVNYGLDKVIGFDETGFKGTGDTPYRMEGWDFLLAGGGLYNNLDYSFTVGHEDGTFMLPSTQPGGGSPTLRRQLKILKDFLNGFDFLRMRPENGVIKGGAPEGATVRCLAEAGRAYALYLKGGNRATLTLELPAGHYCAEWVNPRTGATEKTEDIPHSGGDLTLASPPYTEDTALRLIRTP